MYASAFPGPRPAHVTSSPSLALRLITLALLSLACLFTTLALAQNATPPTPISNASALHPPAGARVAIVEFDDLQCPSCATANPTLMQAANTYHIPWIRHDFLIPYHNWSR